MICDRSAKSAYGVFDVAAVGDMDLVAAATTDGGTVAWYRNDGTVNGTRVSVTLGEVTGWND